MKKETALMMFTALALTASAQVKTTVTEFLHAGPYAVTTPFAADSVDVQGKKFDSKSALSALPLEAKADGVYRGSTLPSLDDKQSVGVLTFYLNNSSYIKGKIEVKGPKNSTLYIDGEKAGGELKLAPDHHTFAIRYMAAPRDTDSLCVTIDSPTSITDNLSIDARHPYMVHDLTDGCRVRSASLSADGRYVCLGYQTTERGGKRRWTYELRDTKSGLLLRRLPNSVRWMPRTAAWIEEETEEGVRVLYKTDPMTGSRTRWAAGLPEGSYRVSPTEDYIIVTVEEKGPKEDAGVFEVVEMDDRQPNWRNRDYLCRFDVATGMSQRLTFGSKGQYLLDISNDGKRLLVGSSYSRLAKRPTEVEDIYLIDAQTMDVDTLMLCEGFINSALLSPDGRQLLVKGTPEAFGRIGCQLPENVTPSLTEGELFVYDIATKQVTPLTKDFDPSVERYDWSAADGNIYFSAEDRDYIYFYRIDPATGNISQLSLQGDYIYNWDMAANANVAAWLAYKTLEPASAYVINTKKVRAIPYKSHSLVEERADKQGEGLLLFDGRSALGDAEVGTCQDWNFKNSHGDTVYGRLYLPKDFDATKKYPMIVYYYGGCSPVSRYFESPYAPQYWNSLGYVAYIPQPSGCTGFGQEWASRHVNTAGGLVPASLAAANGTVAEKDAGGTPAGDIIEGVKQLCAVYSFIDASKIGCMGASYGGFMTQYLQTVTDIFAAAVSHAGIANHTSYWGEGYWGYNYSEVSMANSYPWSHRQLYVDQSPLFRADKINTPLLLLHGNADTNVPLIESLQMFTALKLLGREVALVEVEGENHHINDYKKREKWLATQMAWFQKWLKGDPSWWDALYPKKHL